jgi:chromosome partitioning protein
MSIFRDCERKGDFMAGKIICITNNKGGTAKTTTTVTVGVGMAAYLRTLGAKNRRILLVDTDSQAHASLLATGRGDFGKQDSLYSVLMAERQSATHVLADCIVASTWDEDLHILPATALLEQAEAELQGTAGAPYRLADPLNQIASQYAAIIIDTRPSFSLMTQMALLAATIAIVPIEPRYLETVGLVSVINKINEIRDGWRHPNLRVGGILVTKMDSRVRGHIQLLDELKRHPQLGKLLLGVVPMNEAVSYAHRSHQSIFNYDPQASASKAYAQVIGRLAHMIGGE